MLLLKRLLPLVLVALTAQTATAATPRCFGAPSAAGCRNPALDTTVTPTPAQALQLPNAPCEPVAFGVPFVCTFGRPRGEGARNVALIGDSHAVHWRAALGPVALTRGWHGSSLTRAGCPYSTVAPILPPRLLPDCLAWRRTIPRWLARHREVDTVFVSEHRVRTAGGLRAQERGYMRAWQNLPRSVTRIVVIRDTPGSGSATRACVNRAIIAELDAGVECAMPRSSVLHADPAAAAARRAHSRRIVLVDMTKYFCDATRCFPVIGGALVHKDNTHITATYGATIAPFLGRRLTKLGV
ncbi:MAG: SGNH hydrolase domain-containing protein [Solirubrobacteraceae bacterium]